MFFVLSGFVLSRPYVAAGGEDPRPIFLPTFYLRRLTRIWLPWFAAFAVSAIARHFFIRSWSLSRRFQTGSAICGGSP
jgi:peptidoglycan/LPS O-acetylase OafA/YrhL